MCHASKPTQRESQTLSLALLHKIVTSSKDNLDLNKRLPRSHYWSKKPPINTKGLFGFAVSITRNSVSITYNSKMVRPMAERLIWILFSIIVSITQFSDFWVISYGNWKHILGVFNFQNSVFNDISVIKHTLRVPRSESNCNFWPLFFHWVRWVWFLLLLFFLFPFTLGDLLLLFFPFHAGFGLVFFIIFFFLIFFFFFFH